MIDKIKELFESINCPPEAVLETDRAGEEVDNGYGIEFPLPQFAVIHHGDAYEESALNKVSEFQRENNVKILKFEFKGCSPLDGLLDDLNERDGYVIKWRKNAPGVIL